jgi:hypothetical protein
MRVANSSGWEGLFFTTPADCGCLVFGGGDWAAPIQQINVPAKGSASQPDRRETHAEGMSTWTDLRERHFMEDGYDSIGKRRSLT